MSVAKIKEGIFIGPQIRKLLKDIIFKTKLGERRTCMPSQSVSCNFFGNKKTQNWYQAPGMFFIH
jgi:hypothetical protein